MEEEAKSRTGAKVLVPSNSSHTDAMQVQDPSPSNAGMLAPQPSPSLHVPSTRQPSGSLFYIQGSNSSAASSSSSSRPSLGPRKSNASSRRSYPAVDLFVAGSSNWQDEYYGGAHELGRRTGSGSMRMRDCDESEKSRIIEVTDTRPVKDVDEEKAAAATSAGYDTREGRYAYKFWSPEMASLRHQYLTLIARVVLLIVLLMWTCLPIYWSSLAHSATHTNHLTAWFVNRDSGRIGTSIRSAIQGMPPTGRGSLGWVELDPAEVGDDSAVMDGVIQGKAWIAVVVSANASSNLSEARMTGDESYDPTSAITVYYATARNEIAASNYLLPITQSMLRVGTTSFASSSAQLFFARIHAQDSTVNATALDLVARAPQTIAPAVSWKEVDLRRYTAPVAQAVTLVGQIYICIFAFIVVMAHTHARTFVEPYLTFTSYLTLRILCPILTYIPLSLSYALIQLPFKLPFEARFTFGGGFVLFFVYIWLGMCALGLALEAMITILTPRFVPFFLVLMIIVNVSTAALPPELQPSLFQYGAGFPFWNMEQAVRTIIFNTYSHMGKNAGVLIAWIMLSCLTLSALVWYMRREVITIGVRAPRQGKNSNGKAAQKHTHDADDNKDDKS